MGLVQKFTIKLLEPGYECIKNRADIPVFLSQNMARPSVSPHYYWHATLATFTKQDTLKEEIISPSTHIFFCHKGPTGDIYSPYTPAFGFQ